MESLSSPLCDHAGEVVHRMALGRLHEMVWVADDVVFREIGGAARAVTIHGAAPPDRLAFRADQHPLVHVEAPAVVARQPGHVRRVGNEEQLDAFACMAARVLGEARGVFSRVKLRAGPLMTCLPDGGSGGEGVPAQWRERGRRPKSRWRCPERRVPVRSQSVTASGDARPGARPATTAPSSSKSCAAPITPAVIAWCSSPSRRVCDRRSAM